MVERDIDFLNEEIDLRWLFASKALLQIFVTPISAFAIDQIGSKLPMIIGLIGMFLSTLIFALGKSYSVLFFARTLQVNLKIQAPIGLSLGSTGSTDRLKLRFRLKLRILLNFILILSLGSNLGLSLRLSSRSGLL